jgi:hypothetical protein
VKVVTIPVITEMKVTQTIHPDDDDNGGEVCDAADHASAVGGEWQHKISFQ